MRGQQGKQHRAASAKKLTWACLLAATTEARAQTPSCNLIWEINDGSGWRSGDVSTSQLTVSVRLRADWSAPGNNPFFFVAAFDATVDGAEPGDSVSALHRETPFLHGTSGFSGQLTDYRFGSTIKMDSISDSLAAAVGSGWIDTFQSPDTLPSPDYSRSIPLFSYTLNLAEVSSQRSISCALFQRAGLANVRIWVGNSVLLDVQPVLYGATVTYVPAAPACGVLLVPFLGRRRRASA